MSSQVLARKWRPKTFADVVGQQHILTALANGLRENRLHHAYLFSGTRGVGKTSIARLFAKGLNCINGISAEPCGECEHCQAIEQGNFIDLIEIDAASRTKVEDTRELLDNVQYKPVQGRYKVYLIDEVHMLSRHSFNALLKTLEEPPEYVKFLLATTDPQKLPMTILSRCMQFHLKALEVQQISQHLAFILQQENIPFEALALDKLAKAAQGSIRDSLSLTDQAIAMSNGNIKVSIVNQMLGLLDTHQAIDVLYALQRGDGEKLMQHLDAVAAKGVDWDELLREIAEYLHQIAMYQWLPNKSVEENDLAFLANHLNPEDVQFFYQVMLSGRKELAFAPNRRMGVEMTLLRALAFMPKNFSATAEKVSEKKENQQNSQTTQQSAVLSMPKVTEIPQQSSTVSAEEKSSPAQQIDNQSISSPALEGINQLAVLDQLKASHQKKNADQNLTSLATQSTLTTKISSKPTALPVLDVPPKEQHTTNTKNSLSKPDLKRAEKEEFVEEEAELEQANLAETYRWQWTNPELAKVPEMPTPSSIQASLKKGMTEELQQKITALARQKDLWVDRVESLAISGITKEFALNTCLVLEQENQIQLAISPDFRHLNQQVRVQKLEQALQQFYQRPIQLVMQEIEPQGLTPNQHYEQIYQQLCEQAKNDLQQDKALQRLLSKFRAELILDSVIPV